MNDDYDLMLGNLMGMLDEDEARRDVLKLPFSYPGSKVDQLHLILPELPYRKSFIEPFGGSAAVLLNREESPLEVINDRYAGVTALYRVARDPDKIRLLLDRLACVLHSREDHIWCQSTWKDCNDDIERAARWYYTVVFATNSKPETSFGRATKGDAQLGKKYFNALPLFWQLHERLKYCQIENLDWRACINDYDHPEAVFYLDPTYLGTTRAYEFNLLESEHVEICERVFRGKGFFALSGYENPQTCNIYDSYNWTRKVSWKRKTEMAVHCDELFKATEKVMDRQNFVTESLWILDQ